MSQNFLDKFIKRKAWMVVALPAWVLASFILVQVILYLAAQALLALGVPAHTLNGTSSTTIWGALTYVLTLLLVIGLPWRVKKYKTSREELGLTGLPRWLDILLAPLGLLVYVLISALLILIATQFLTFIDLNQVQDTGYSDLTAGFEYLLAFMMLVVIAPIAEEILFRGYLLGKLRKYVPLWVAILVVSLLFGFVHGAWNVGIDVFALSIVLCLLRVWTKTLWAPILLHMLKNAIAFYLLFINPLLLGTLGG
jgi:membrane protease YdiL (CAAX protease family)